MHLPLLSRPMSGLLGALVLFIAAPAHAANLVELTAGMYRIQAELAHTEPTRERGLMFRKEMPEYSGMLFVFPIQAQHCMWMKNTLIPLSVAFMDEQGKIINVEEMKPQTENNHCARGSARYALEMNANWFKQRGLGAGVQIGGLAKVPAPQ